MSVRPKGVGVKSSEVRRCLIGCGTEHVGVATNGLGAGCLKSVKCETATSCSLLHFVTPDSPHVSHPDLPVLVSTNIALS